MFQDKLNENLKGLPGLLANPHQACTWVGVSCQSWIPGCFFSMGHLVPAETPWLMYKMDKGEAYYYMKTAWPPRTLDISSSCCQDVCLIYSMDNGFIFDLLSQCQASTLTIQEQLAVTLHQTETSSHFDKARLQGGMPPRGCRDRGQK